MGKSRPAVIGLFVVGALALGMGGLLAFGGNKWLSPSNEAVIFFDQSVGGLSTGSPVTFRGVEIGSVTRVTLEVEPDTFRVLMPVFIELTPGDVVISGRRELADNTPIDIERLVQRGLRAKLETRSMLTGQLAVDLDFMPGSAAKLHAKQVKLPEIPAMESRVEQLKRAVTEFPWQETLNSINRTMTAMESLSVNLERDLQGIGTELRATVVASRALVDSTHAHVDSLGRRTAQSLDRIDSLAEHGRRTLTESANAMDNVTSQAAATLERIDIITGHVGALAHPQSPERDDLRRLLRNLSSSSATLKRFAEEIESDPNALLFGREDHPL